MRIHPLLLLGLGASLLCFAPAPSVAQKVPKRPKLAASSDTNSAQAYFRLGLDVMERNAKEAAAALYWATRLEPGWAEALYARRVAELRADPRAMVGIFKGDERTQRRKETLQRDSLLIRAWAINPFLPPSLDPPMIRHVLREVVEREIRRSDPTLRPEDFRNEIQYEINRMLAGETSLPTRAWIAYGEGRYPEALGMYERLLRGEHKNPFLHDDRATMFFLTGDFSGAEQELSHALTDLRDRDRTPQVVYQSKAVLVMKRAIALARLERLDEARAALHEALVEDLAFYPAHLILGNIALAEEDTTGALREYQLAAELAPGEPLPRIQYSELLLATQAPREAIAILTDLVEREPYFARGHRLLGDAHLLLDQGTLARAAYTAFLQRAAADDPGRNDVEQRLHRAEGST